MFKLVLLCLGVCLFTAVIERFLLNPYSGPTAVLCAAGLDITFTACLIRVLER